MGFPQKPVLFEDTATDLLTSIRTEFGVVSVSDIPNPRPERFVQIEDVGGRERTEFSEDVRLNVSCWAKYDTDAFDLAQQVRKHLRTLVGPRPNGTTITHVEITAPPADIPDPESRQPRYRMTVNIHVTCLIEEFAS